ncbi:GTP-binding protein of the ras superfamily involved in termination of M-phase, partial [Reticulomyxa filosa]
MKPTKDTKATKPKSQVSIPVSIMGESNVGKTTLMLRYVAGEYERDCASTLVQLDKPKPRTEKKKYKKQKQKQNKTKKTREKVVHIKNVDVILSIWDVGGRNCEIVMPSFFEGALAVLLVFDLTNFSSLLSLKNWYKKTRKVNKVISTQKKKK